MYQLSCSSLNKIYLISRKNLHFSLISSMKINVILRNSDSVRNNWFRAQVNETKIKPDYLPVFSRHLEMFSLKESGNIPISRNVLIRFFPKLCLVNIKGHTQSIISWFLLGFPRVVWPGRNIKSLQ